jgi:hypothetical protein
MKVLLLTAATILGVSAISSPTCNQRSGRTDAGKCVRHSTRAGRHVLRDSNLAGHSVSG